MTLRVRLDHRLDRLADALIEHLAEPPADPFAEDVVVVPTLGVGRWLQQRVARRHGVCARLRVDFAGRVLWRLFARLLPDLPERSPFDPDVARWSVLAACQALPPSPELAPLAAHLASATPAERLALAGDVARQFEAYLAYRRDWLARWQRGRPARDDGTLGVHEPWQRWLWGRLLERLRDIGARHPFDRVAEVLDRDPAHARAALGAQRVALLGAVAMAPEQLALFARLGTVADVSIFAPDPCRELWDDLVDPRALARVRAERPDVAWLYDSEPAVLGHWGRAQRDAVAQLCALEELAGVQIEAPFRDEPAAFERAAARGEPVALGTLQALQAAVLVRSDAPWSAATADASLQVHATHGTLRQAEVLHDRLLECFAQLPGLRPSDVAVFCASVDDAAEAIESVFASAPADQRIPVAISGRKPRVQPLVAAVLDLLSAAARGASLASLAGWLDNPAVAAGLGLDDERVGELVRWLDAAGVRWGVDAHDGPPKHQWEGAVDRMLLGIAVGEGAGAVGDLLPVAAPGQGDAALVAAVLPVVDALRALRDADRAPRTVPQWADVLRRIVDSLFGRARRDAEALAGVLEALSALQAGASGEPGVTLDLVAFAQALAEQLERGASAAVAAGAVTVCGLGALRGVPFRVICLFGMDEAAFPRRAPAAEIDLMARAPRFGDRVARTDDRGAFLDALLAAADRVLVFHSGRDPRDDTVRSPSSPVTELLRYVDARLPAEAGACGPVLHPLHAFSPRAFRGDAASHAWQWLDTARALDTPRARRPAGSAALAPASAFDGPSREDDRVLTLRDVRDALADPARTWLRRTLGLRLPGEHLAIDALEPLWDDARRDRVLVDRVARRLLEGADPRRLHAELRASPATAAGAAGRVHADRLIARAQRLVDAACAGLPPDAAAARPCGDGSAHVELRIPDDDGDLVVAGAIGVVAPSLPVVCGFPVGARALIDAWVAHAVRLRVLAQRGAPPDVLDAAVTCLAAEDCTLTLRGPQPALDDAVRCARRIRSVPLPLLPRTSLAYHRHDRDASKAHDAMFGDEARRRGGELDRPWVAALHRDDPPGLDAVLDAGAAVYGPIFEAFAWPKQRNE